MKRESTLRYFDVSGSQQHVVIEDDDRVAYAYLLDNDNKIVGDVWLYNVEPAPDRLELLDGPEMMPFLNPKEFCSMESISRITYDSNVICVANDGYVSIEVDGLLVARLKAGAKPGWSRLACKHGPLALKL